MFLTNQNARTIKFNLQMLISFRPARKSSDFPVYNSALIPAQVNCERRRHDKDCNNNKKERDRDKPMGKNALIVYKSENPAITIFLLKQMLKCFRNHINMYLTTKSDYFMTAFTSIYLLIAFFVLPPR